MKKTLTSKVLMLGVDGLDPKLAKKFMDQGLLPNMKKFVDRGAQRESLQLLCTPPTITPPLWTTLATGALPMTHGITCFWRQDHDHLDTSSYNLDSRLCEAEALWNVTAEAGKKTLVWHWPGSSWPPTSDSPNLHVVDGTQPACINAGMAKLETEKIVLANTSFQEVLYKPGATNNTGAGCIIENLPESKDIFDNNNLLGGLSMRNIILSHDDGENSLDGIPFDLCNSPIKDATGWANAPDGAKEFYIVTSNGLIRRPCLILKNEAGKYDKVAYYHSKKDSTPLVILEKDQYVVGIVDEYVHEDKTVQGNRNMILLDLDEDGNMARIWMSMTLDIAHENLFYPTSLYKQVVENIGHCPPSPAAGGIVPELVEKAILPTWDNVCQWQANALNYLIATNQYEIVFSHIHNVDAMGHMFWQFAKNSEQLNKYDQDFYQDMIKKVYCQTDNYLGQFLHFLDEEWTVFIFSDHGLLITQEEEVPLIGDAFGCNIRVMEELGFTVLKKDKNGNDLKEIDWENTTAVATRGGHIWLNLKGRDSTGIVDPAEKYEMERKVIDGLYGYRLNGKRVISVAMRNKDAVLLGTGGPECGDILYWLEEGFNRLHGDALPTVEGYSDSSVSPIFIAAGKGLKQGYQSPRIIRQVDLAPTVAHMLGIRMPHQCEGAVTYQILMDDGH